MAGQVDRVVPLPAHNRSRWSLYGAARLVAACSCLVCAMASAEPFVDLGRVGSLQALYDAALGVPGTHVHAVLGGEMGQALANRFSGAGDVGVESWVVRSLARTGCARFATKFTPSHIPAGAPPSMTLQMNWCQDGGRPQDGDSTVGAGGGGASR
jgi:hypothetical protein